MGVFRQLGDPVGVGVCLCQHHGVAYAERETVGSTFFRELRYDSVANNGVIVQQAITTTERCCIVVNTAMITDTDEIATGFEIERPQGTIKTIQEDTVLSNTVHLHHHAAWEVLPAGTYTYYLMNRLGAIAHPYAAWMKIIASDCEG